MKQKLIFWTVLFLTCSFHANIVSSKTFYAKDHVVIDLVNRIEWLRCSVGQRWDGKTCIGDVILMNHETIKKAILLANEQLGGSWRLPTLKELESLVCKECKTVFNSCKNPKIDKEIFPNTDPRAYWTGQKNFMASKHYWTVNFCTGHRYGRFYPEQEMAVRLLRDR